MALIYVLISLQLGFVHILELNNTDSFGIGPGLKVIMRGRGGSRGGSRDDLKPDGAIIKH